MDSQYMYRTFSKSQPIVERYSPVFQKQYTTATIECLPELKSPISYYPLFYTLYAASTSKPERKVYNLQASAVSIVGRRPTNEDKHLIVQQQSVYIFAVFDGHGGDYAAQYCASNFYQQFAQFSLTTQEPETLLKQTISQLDSQFCKYSKFSTVGSTASLLLVQNGQLYYSNTGDSRCVVNYANGNVFASKDHSPANERSRLKSAGVRIVKCQGIERVEGNLSVARSIGDYYMKNKGIISDPDVGLVCRLEDFKYAVIACDGLFGIFSTETVCNIVNSCLSGRAVSGAPQQRLLEASAAYFVGDSVLGDYLLGKIVRYQVYKTRSCCDVDGIISDPSRRIAQILCKLAYWKGSMDNISVVVVLK